MPALRPLALLPFLLPLATHAHGQAKQEPRDINVSGQVVDSSTGTGVATALVIVTSPHLEAVTDTAGRFRLALPPGRYRIEVHRIGYVTTVVEFRAREGKHLRIELSPEPTLLKGLTVVANRLASRRARATSPILWAGARELTTSTEWDAVDFLRYHLGLHTAECGAMRTISCARVRGRLVHLTVYVDGHCAVGGLETLTMYRPDEFYAVEVYSGGAAVVFYTNAYMERVARGELHLGPALPLLPCSLIH